jgi:hypothetical protein
MVKSHTRRPGAVAGRGAWSAAYGWPVWSPYLVLGLVTTLSYWLVFLGRGLDVPDEGLLLHVAERLADGQVPYRDVYFIYTPGFQYLLAGLFRMLGPSLAVEHALLFAVHVALVLVVYGLAARLAWRPLAVAAALVVMASGVSPYRTLAGLVTILALTRYAETGRRAWLTASGLLIGGSYLVGQEIGVYTLGAALGLLAVEWLGEAGVLGWVRSRLPGAQHAVGGDAVTNRAAGDKPLPYVPSRQHRSASTQDAVRRAVLVVAAAPRACSAAGA